MNKMSKKSTSPFENLLSECSKRLIEKDGSTILSYVLANKDDGMITLSLIPYIALYCRSAQEFFEENIIENELDKQIKDLRNGLKIYSDRYTKGKAATMHSDEYQNQVFRDMLRFSFMKGWNIHYNLGVYFDMEGHIISDTQILNFYLNFPITKTKNQKKHAFEIGKILGEKVVFVLRDLCGLENIEMKEITLNILKYGYQDFNTNRKSDFFYNKVDKELNLIILHILSSVGFVEHVLCSMLPKDNTWVFRIEYIVAHYAWSGLRKIKQHFDNNDIKDCEILDDIHIVIDKGRELFPSSFRNCMMHYDLCNKENSVIMEEKFNIEEPLYGLVESCFDGKSYDEFTVALRRYIMELEEYLSLWFQVDMKKIKWYL